VCPVHVLIEEFRYNSAMRVFRFCLVGLLSLVAACTAPEPTGVSPLPETRFRARTGTGIDLVNRSNFEDSRWVLYGTSLAGGGVSVGDYDGDGLPDLFVAGQAEASRLYRQVEPFRFEDVTETAGLSVGSQWTTGSAFVDLNGDGLLDLLVLHYGAPNQLYLNQGGGRFTLTTCGLEYSGASLQVAIRDYDRDGDLDVFLLTYRTYPEPGSVNPYQLTRTRKGLPQVTARFREQWQVLPRPDLGPDQYAVVASAELDHLYRNDGNGRFEDVSREAGIRGTDHGNSATWWDYDDDGWPDLYVGNDFWGPDKLYRNNRDGTFTDMRDAVLPHTPWFSMGADTIDLDGDGRLDFMIADMAGTTHEKSKRRMGPMSSSRWFLEHSDQRMRNAVYRNTGVGMMQEMACLSGLEATDWTWSMVAGDFDADGWEDVFVSNGMTRSFFDSDFQDAVRAVEARGSRELARGAKPEAVMKRTDESRRELSVNAPDGREKNLYFRNRSDLTFESVPWGPADADISFGAVPVDLDRDGDLDLVINRVDAPVQILENTGTSGRTLAVQLQMAGANPHGIGSRIRVHADGREWIRDIRQEKGFASSGEAIAHFGLGGLKHVEWVEVRWPDGSLKRVHNVKTDTFLTIPWTPETVEPEDGTSQLFTITGSGLPAHRDVRFDELAAQPLIPFRHDTLGPPIAAAGDLVYVGGGEGQAGVMVRITEEGVIPLERQPWEAHRDREDVGAAFADVDGDGDADLIVTSGGVSFPVGDERYGDRLYRNTPDGFEVDPAFPGGSESSDVDRDDDLDLVLGGRVSPGAFPTTPTTRVLVNTDGRFAEQAEHPFSDLGMVTDFSVGHLLGDDVPDLVVTRFWARPMVFESTDAGWVDRTSTAPSGLWLSAALADVDGDGDDDVLLGNLGLNTRYHASSEHPLRLYYADVDGDGDPVIVESEYERDRELPTRGRSCSSEAVPDIREQFKDYHAFTQALLDEIYPRAVLADSETWSATELRSGVLLNEKGQFRFLPFANELQISPIRGFLPLTIGGRRGCLILENLHSPQPETGRMDGGIGQWCWMVDGSLQPMEPSRSGLRIRGEATGAVYVKPAANRGIIVVARNDASPLRVEWSEGPSQSD
jgi:hypothetical protein